MREHLDPVVFRSTLMRPGKKLEEELCTNGMNCNYHVCHFRHLPGIPKCVQRAVYSSRAIADARADDILAINDFPAVYMLRRMAPLVRIGTADVDATIEAVSSFIKTTFKPPFETHEYITDKQVSVAIEIPSYIMHFLRQDVIRSVFDEVYKFGHDKRHADRLFDAHMRRLIAQKIWCNLIHFDHDPVSLLRQLYASAFWMTDITAKESELFHKNVYVPDSAIDFTRIVHRFMQIHMFARESVT